jgi:hypothetical protein
MPYPYSVGPVGQPDATRWTLSDNPAAYPGPYVNGNDRYLVLVNAGDNANGWDGVGGGVPANRAFVHVIKCTDPIPADAVNWAEQDAGNARELPQGNILSPVILPATFRYRSVSVIQLGTVLYIARLMWDYVTYLSAAPRTAVISRFNMAGDAWMADLTTAADPLAPVIPPITGPYMTGGSSAAPFYLTYRPADGHLFLFYFVADVVPASPRFPNPYDHAVYSEWIPGGAGWQAPAYLYGNALTQEDTYPMGPAVEGDANRLHFLTVKFRQVAAFNNAQELLHNALPFGGALTAAQSIFPEFDGIDGIAGGANYGVPIARLNGATKEIVLSFIEARRVPFVPAQTGVLYVLRATSADVPAWGTATIESTAAPFAPCAWTNRSTMFVPVAATDAGALHLFSRGELPAPPGASAWDNLNQLDDGWGALPAAMLYNQPLGLLGAVEAYTPPGAGLIGITFTNGPGTGYQWDDVWYFELAAAAPPVVVTPAPQPRYQGKVILKCGNVWDWCLANDKRLWSTVDWSFYGCRPCRCWRDVDNPLHLIPEQGREFHKYGAIGVPLVPNLDTQIFQFDVPLGYDGIIYGVLCKYVGWGFTNGSGDLIWRFRMNRHWIKSLHEIPTELGDFTAYAQLDEFVRVYSGQTIRAFGWLSPASGIVPAPDKRMIAAVQGWYYPMELAR